MPKATDRAEGQPTTVSVYRANRARILEALHDCTGIYGDDLAAPRVKEFIDDPDGASTRLLGYISGLTLDRFYVARDKPAKSDRAVLWHALMQAFETPGAKDPGGWGPNTNTAQLHGIVDEAVQEQL